MRPAALLLLCAAALAGQTPKMSTVLYGASYYHEYMPYERLDKDVELMRKAGLSVVRVGEAVRGSVQVVYSRAMPVFEEGPFLQEERNLIEEVAHQVGLIVDRWEDAKAKAKLFHMLEQRRE